MKLLATLILAGAAVATALACRSTPTGAAGTAGARDAVFASRLQMGAASAYSDGTRYLKQKKYSQAVTAFQSAIRHHDHLVGAYGGLGAAETYLVNYPAAFQAYKKAAGLQPNNAFYQYEAGWTALYSRKQSLLTYAAAYSNNFIQLRPKAAKGYILQFLAYGGLLNAKAQLNDAKHLIKLRPQSADSYNFLGIAYANGHKIGKAIPAFDRAVRIDPTNYQYRLNRGEVEQDEKQWKKALADYRKASSLTTDPKIKQGLGKLIAKVKTHLHH